METIAILFFGKIGDVINSSPLCEAVKSIYLDSRLIYITSPQGYETAKALPSIDQVYIFDRKNKDKGILKLIKSALNLKKQVKIDKIFLLNDTFSSALYAYLTGAKERTGRDYQKRGFLLTNKVPYFHEDHYIHISDFFLGLIEDLIPTDKEYQLNLKISEEDNIYAENLIKDLNLSNKKLIGLNPCSADVRKDWKEEETAKFIDLINKNTDYKVILLGGKESSNFSNKIKQIGISDFIDLTEKTTLYQLMALVSKLDKLVSVDTGTAHIAYALKIPTVALFFQKNFERWGSTDSKINRIIYNSENIDAQSVFDIIQGLE